MSAYVAHDIYTKYTFCVYGSLLPLGVGLGGQRWLVEVAQVRVMCRLKAVGATIIAVSGNE